MNRKRLSLFVPILWSVLTVLWIVLLCLDLTSPAPSEGLVVMRALCVLCSLAAAIVSWIRWKTN